MKYPAGYGIVFKAVMCDPSIRVEVKALYALLASYTGAGDSCWPSVPTMAKALGCSDQSVRNWCGELEGHGWLRVVRSDRSTNEYELQIPPAPGSSPPSTPVEGTPSTPVEPTINSLTKNNDNPLRSPPAHAKKTVPLRTATDFYQDRYLEEYPVKPTWDGKVIKLLKADLARLGLERWKELVGLFFDDPGYFVTKNGTGKGYNIFHSQVDHLIERYMKQPAPPTDEEVARREKVAALPYWMGGRRG